MTNMIKYKKNNNMNKIDILSAYEIDNNDLNIIKSLLKSLK